MAEPTLKQQINDAMKAAMRAREKERLGTIRLIQAEIKRIEVDERIDLGDDDPRVLAILDKMVKQRKDSAQQYHDANRPELAAVEEAEITVIQDFLPEALSDAELEAMVDEAISTTGASAMQDMGKIMGLLKPKLQGRADMGQVSGLVKARLA